MANYVCAELDEDNATYTPTGTVMGCKTWVVQQSVLSEFAITKAEAHEIALSLSGFFVVCLVFAIVIKAIKSS